VFQYTVVLCEGFPFVSGLACTCAKLAAGVHTREGTKWRCQITGKDPTDWKALIAELTVADFLKNTTTFT
jgi:hypothetical protein